MALLCTSVLLVPPVQAAEPDAPTGLTAVAGNGQVTLTWIAPVDTGGSPINDYQVYNGDPGVEDATRYNCNFVTPTSTSCVVTGLTNGVRYEFYVLAHTVSGNFSTFSDGAAAVPGVPGAPSIGSATAGNGQATVTFAAPASQGGAAITGYTVTAHDSTNPGNGGQTASGSGSPITVTGLTNGHSYTFTVVATNAVGDGAQSAATLAVTPSMAAVPGVPGAPSIGSATGGNGQARVAFAAPASDGGAAITRYTVTAHDSTNPGGGDRTASGSGSPITVTGLTNGHSYTFTVVATNAAGDGPASAPSNSVALVAPAPPVMSPVRDPQIQGVPVFGGELRVLPGSWAAPPTTVAFQWHADGAPISGATGPRFVPTRAQVGKRISVSETAVAPGYTSATAVSGQTRPALRGTATVAKRPTIRGSADLGSVLRVRPVRHTPQAGVLRYQWYRGAKAIRGARAATYRIVRADVGQRLSVRVVVTARDWLTATRDSRKTVKVRR